MTGAEGQDVTIEAIGSMALVTLDRTKALNALTAAMRAKLAEGLWSFARDPQVYAVVIQSAGGRAFSAGSDVREIMAAARIDRAQAARLFADEYALNWQWECFSKPTIPLIDGLVMGGGVGISLYGTHRVAGESYRFAMPETQIGLFPDVGTAHVFARLPGHMGAYLGLTGHTIGRADAFALGLVTHCIEKEQFEAIKAEIADTWPVDPALDGRHREPGPGELAPFAETIDRCFSGRTVEEIVERLEAEAGRASDWARATAADLRRRSPTSLKITLRHIREAGARDLRETLIADYRLALRCLEGHDFAEGVRAAIIDKDGEPRWQPDRLEDVSQAIVDDYFAPAGAGELTLPTRQEMQALRA